MYLPQISAPFCSDRCGAYSRAALNRGFTVCEGKLNRHTIAENMINDESLQ